jgi:hypothetical protein
VARLLLYYAFNETAGSSKVVDYSGSGFDATTQNGPYFSGTSMRLYSYYRQYLSINSALGPAFKALDSFTVTLSLRYPQVRTSIIKRKEEEIHIPTSFSLLLSLTSSTQQRSSTRPRIFNFGVLGK